MVEKDDIYGDGVNVAARLEGTAETGDMHVASSLGSSRRQLALTFRGFGPQTLKNIAKP